MVDIYVAGGLLAVEVVWDAPGIWGGTRARTLACRYATVAWWIYDNLHQATPGARFIAQGTSDGASQIAFALAHYGLDEIVTDAHLASGPPRCPSCSPTPGFAPEPLLSGTPRLNYPNTTVRFFLGADEPTPQIVTDTNAYYNAITSSKSFLTVPATARDVENTREGQQALIAAVRQALAATPTPTPTAAPARPTLTPTPPAIPVPASAFQKGMAFGAWRAGHYSTIGAELSLENLLPTGTNWIQLVVVGIQSSLSSTIDRTSARTNTDADLAHAIQMAHSRGLRVMLKPGVSLSDDSPNFHTQIGTTFTAEEQWRAWFQAYEEFIGYYAELAERNRVEIFSIGVELVGTTHRKDDWLRIIRSVRQQYHGQLTYGSLRYDPYGQANPPNAVVCPCPLYPPSDVTKIEWWDALDYIGVQVWPRLTTKNDPTVEELKQAWVEKGLVDQFEEVSRRFDKPIIFTEIGYNSMDGSAKGPGVSQMKGIVDLQEQADLYQAVFEVFWGKPWLAGIYWWQWHVVPDFPAGTAGGPNDDGGSPYEKPAEEVLRRYYQQR